MARAFQGRWQWGVDIVWTYGPLGTFAAPIYEPDLYWAHLGAEALLKAAFTAILLGFAAGLRPLAWRVAFALLASLTLPVAIDAQFVLCSAALTCLIVGESAHHRVWLWLGVGLWSICSLMKLSWLPTIFACIAAVALDRRLRGGRWEPVAVLGAYTALVATAWAALGQAFGNPPAFARSTAHIIAGYGDAMSQTDDSVQVGLAGLCILTGRDRCSRATRPTRPT